MPIVGRNQAGDWFNLDNGAWIAASLVHSAPTGAPLQIIAAPVMATTALPTAMPNPNPPTAPAVAPPTATAIPPTATVVFMP